MVSSSPGQPAGAGAQVRTVFFKEILWTIHLNILMLGNFLNIGTYIKVSLCGEFVTAVSSIKSQTQRKKIQDNRSPY